MFAWYALLGMIKCIKYHNFSNSSVTLPKSKSLQGISECKTIDEILCMKMYFETYYHEAQEICPRHCTVIEYDGKLSYKYKINNPILYTFI